MQTLLDLIHLCLSPANERPTPEQLLHSGLFPAHLVTPSLYHYSSTR